MLSYQHAYHAGNLADVHKHALLAVALARMVEKPKPLSYLETHAGRGLYDLGSEAAQRTQEAEAGIARALAQGWLRVSHRKLDKKLTLPYRPYHTHDEEQKLKKGEIVECDVEVWPTCIVVPAGYRLALSVRGKDYVYPGGGDGAGLKTLGTFTGVGPFRHDDPRDRPAAVFGGDVTLHAGPERHAYVMLPVIPEE